MSLLQGINTTTDTVEEEKDVLGGYQPFESDVYEFSIKLAYLDEAVSGAISVNFTLEDAQGKTLRTTEYITSGNAKGRKNYYEKDGKKRYLPGFNLVNSISLLSVGKELHKLTPTTGVLKIYDYKTQKELPKECEILSELQGVKIKIGVLQEIVDKVQKAADGSYVPTGETRVQNSINKVFRASDGLTVAEIKAQVTEPEFLQTWLKKNKGTIRTTATGKTTILTNANSVPTTDNTSGSNPFASKNPFETPPETLPETTPDLFKKGDN